MVVEMTMLMRRVRTLLQLSGTGDVHSQVFHSVAEEFGLYGQDGEGAPIWLSRIVEGEMRDRENNEGWWDKPSQLEREGAVRDDERDMGVTHKEIAEIGEQLRKRVDDAMNDINDGGDDNPAQHSN
jgi:hypothetical protein